MKKLTAKVAKQLSNKSTASYITNFNSAILFIQINAKLGMSNCFIDGTEKNLKVLKKELQERGFRCHIETTGGFFGSVPTSKPFLSVEW
jgi:hypothetical protein